MRCGEARKHLYLVSKFSLADLAFMPVIPSVEGLKLSDSLALSENMKMYIERLKTRAGYKGASFTSFEKSGAVLRGDSNRTVPGASR